MFFVEFSEFWDYFDKIYLCKFFPQNWRELQIQSRWISKSAGGCPNFVTFVNNSQYSLTVATKTQMFIVLSQGDARKFGKKISQLSIGMILLKNGITGRRVIAYEEENVISQTNFANTRERVIEVTLEPNELPYTLIPCTFEPDQESGYKISIYSDNEAKLIPISPETDWKEQQFQGQWTPEQSGGCGNNPLTWKSNPQFRFIPQQDINVVFHLAKFGESAATGIYIFGLSDTKKKVMAQNKVFLDGKPATIAITLPQNKEGYIIMPCTFYPAIFGPFVLTVFSDHQFYEISMSPERLV